MAEGSRKGECRSAIGITQVNISPSIQELQCNLLVSFKANTHECAVTCRILPIGMSPVLKQEIRHAGLIVIYGQYQRRKAPEIRCMYYLRIIGIKLLHSL